jgi:hypothetical protein
MAKSAVKALPPALSDAWAQLPSETDDEYEAFLVWLDAGDDRRSPLAKWSSAANRFEWAARVLAYERAHAIAAPSAEAPEIQITSNLMHLVQIETGKLLRASATTIGPIASVTDIVKVLTFLADMQRAGMKNGPPPSNDVVNVEKMSTEDLRKLYEAQEIMLRAKGM